MFGWSYVCFLHLDIDIDIDIDVYGCFHIMLVAGWDTNHLGDYIYHLAAGPATGHGALPVILLPGELSLRICSMNVVCVRMCMC